MNFLFNSFTLKRKEFQIQAPLPDLIGLHNSRDAWARC
jgi:hypothetical protein